MKELTPEENLKAKEKFDRAIVAMRKLQKLLHPFKMSGVKLSKELENLSINELPVDPSSIEKVFLLNNKLKAQLDWFTYNLIFGGKVSEEIEKQINVAIGHDWSVGHSLLFTDIGGAIKADDGIPCPKIYVFEAVDASLATNITERSKLPLIKGTCVFAHDAYDPFVEHDISIVQ